MATALNQTGEPTAQDLIDHARAHAAGVLLGETPGRTFL